MRSLEKTDEAEVTNKVKTITGERSPRRSLSPDKTNVLEEDGWMESFLPYSWWILSFLLLPDETSLLMEA